MEDWTGLVRPPLFAGERILWSGQPGKRLVLRKIDFFLIPFSFVWAGFVVSMGVSTWDTDTPWAVLSFHGVFLAVGFYFTVGRFLVDAYRLSRLRYFVTSQRIVIMREGSGSIESLDIGRLPNLAMNQKSDGTGSLLFGEEAVFGRGSSLGIWQATGSSPPRFLAIPDVARVFQLIAAQVASA